MIGRDIDSFLRTKKELQETVSVLRKTGFGVHSARVENALQLLERLFYRVADLEDVLCKSLSESSVEKRDTEDASDGSVIVTEDDGEIEPLSVRDPELI